MHFSPIGATLAQRKDPSTVATGQPTLVESWDFSIASIFSQPLYLIVTLATSRTPAMSKLPAQDPVDATGDFLLSFG